MHMEKREREREREGGERVREKKNRERKRVCHKTKAHCHPLDNTASTRNIIECLQKILLKDFRRKQMHKAQNDDLREFSIWTVNYTQHNYRRVHCNVICVLCC